jgi:hypothetical protein
LIEKFLRFAEKPQNFYVRCLREREREREIQRERKRERSERA